MGDGPGGRARGVPGATNPEADRYDDQVTAALAAADPGALAALDPGRDQEPIMAGRAAWQVLAGAASAGAFTADLRYAAAPFEVSDYVATWMRAHRAQGAWGRASSPWWERPPPASRGWPPS